MATRLKPEARPWLLGAFVAGVAADALTTLVGLAGGATEGWAVSPFLFRHFGLALGLTISIVGRLAACAGLCWWYFKHSAFGETDTGNVLYTGTLWILIVITWVFVANNIIILIR